MESKYYFYSVDCVDPKDQGWTGYLYIKRPAYSSDVVNILWINDLTGEITPGSGRFEVYAGTPDTYRMRMIDKATYLRALNIWSTCSIQ